MNDATILLDKKLAAQSLGISVRMLEKLVSRGEIQPVRIGDRVLFSRADLLNFVAALARAQDERRQEPMRKMTDLAVI